MFVTGVQTCAFRSDPSGGGAASPRQGRWDPASLRPALRLGGQANRANLKYLRLGTEGLVGSQLSHGNKPCEFEPGNSPWALAFPLE